MVDLEKMKAKFEEEYSLAELSNKIESAHPELAEHGIVLHLMHRTFEKEKSIRGWFEQNDYKMTEKDAAMLLSEFPSNGKFKVYRGSSHGYEEDFYDMQLKRCPSDRYTKLQIDWMNNGVQLCVEFPITEDSIIINWFKDRTRPLSESEISTWGIQKNRYTVDMRKYFAQLDWATGNVIHYNGAYYQQTSHSVMNGIAEALKYSYQFSEE